MRRLFFASVVVCAACLDPTQITVKIDTTYDCAMYPTETALWIGDESGASGPLDSFTATKSCTVGKVVGNIVVVPRKSANDTVYVRVLAGLSGTDPRACSQPLPDAGPDGGTSNLQCIEAKRILRFVSHSKLEVSITLDSACINVRCEKATETCVNGTCVDAHVDPADAGPMPDSGPMKDSGPVFKPATDLFGGFEDVCATTANGPYCWGSNSSSQLGPNAMMAMARGPTPIPLTANVKQMAIGGGHICAHDNMKVFCWGAGGSGQLGRTLMNSDPMPVAVPGLPATIGSVATGGTFTCALVPSVQGTHTWCWGQLLGATIDYGAAAKQLQGFDYTQISAGTQHVCGITAIKNVACWGDNSAGQLGVDPTNPKSSPQPISGPTGASWVSAGSAHTTADNDVGNSQICNTNQCDVGWGSNSASELTYGPNPLWPPKRTGTQATQSAMGENHVCILDMMGIRCRGKNANGETGPGMPGNLGWSAVPLPFAATKVVAGRTFSCALTMGGHVYCWGTIPGVMAMQPMPTEVLLP